MQHERNFPYPDGKYTIDFKIGEKFIEFFGLIGEVKQYDKNAAIKDNLAKKYNLKIVRIYPKDLFPIEKLSNFIDLNFKS